MLRLLSPRLDDGPHTMARDEALLDHATESTIRLYNWAQPTLSLGCFQDYTQVVNSLPTPMPVVRRITGGGAIYHAHEITYALIAFPGRDVPERPAAVYSHLHACIQIALQEAGAQLYLQSQSLGDRRYRSEVRCFASPAQDDLVTAGGAKVLGSAGRQRGPRLLVHGSLKLASNPWDGDRVAGCGLSNEIASTALLQGIARFLAANPEPGSWSQQEEDAVPKLIAARCGNPAWIKERQGPRA